MAGPAPKAAFRRARNGYGHLGYTLIEMLVVLMMIGLLVGSISAISQPSAGNRLQLEAERLAQLLNLAAAESRASGKTLRWTTDGGSYRFWHRQDSGGWMEIRDNDSLRQRQLPAGITITGLTIENRRQRDAARLDFTPQGFIPAYSVELTAGDETRHVSAPPVGDARVLHAPGSRHPQAALH